MNGTASVAGDKDIVCVHTDLATHPHGHYSQATVYQGTVYVSGLLGNSREEHVHADRDIVTQAANCIDDLEAILAAAGSRIDRVLKLMIYVSDISRWPEVNALCAERFGDHKPARAVVPTSIMRYNSVIEIDAVAAQF
jgi:2-iminobutanoate/2-iminopropanoate deaminase